MAENHSAIISEEEGNLSKECQELLHSLPKEKGWTTNHGYLFQGFWCPTAPTLQAVITFQNHFQARNSDVVVASLPKSGTTWLKALTFAVVNRHRFDTENHPLLTSSSQNLVPFLELDIYADNQVPDFSNNEPIRLFGTHIPFPSLGSIKESNCKIVYVCRNPFDTFVSYWHFINKVSPEWIGQVSLDEAFDRYCRGTDGYGPFWNHILGYWNESLKRPNKVLFFKYEDMKKDVVSHLKTLANFIDCPFSEEEETNGVIEEIAKLSSFETMKKLDVNKTGTFMKTWECNTLFRKAEVGDWVNYFTPEMEERMSKIIEEKFGGSGLTFQKMPEFAADSDIM